MICRYPYDALPRLSSREKNLWRELRLHLPADAAGSIRWAERCLAAGGLEIRPLAVGAQSTRLALARRAGASFSLRGSGELQAALVLDGGLATSLLRRMLGTPGDGPRGSVTAGEWGLLAFGLAWLLSSVQTACPWSVGGAPPDEALVEELAADGVEVEIEVEIEDERGQAWLLLPRPTLAALPRRALGGRAHASRLDSLLLSLAVEAGRASLPLEEATNLGIGDLLLFDGCPDPSAAAYSIWLKCGRGGFAATVEGESITLDADYQGGQPPMKSESDKGRVLAESIDVELVVELGRVEISAAEVMTLGKGDVLTLQRALVKPVDLRVGGKLIGRAELVDVDGEAGVRVVELFDASSTGR